MGVVKVPRVGQARPPQPDGASGLARWMLLLLREEGEAPRRPREPGGAHIALRDLAW
jgi:hypothetical protein